MKTTWKTKNNSPRHRDWTRHRTTVTLAAQSTTEPAMTTELQTLRTELALHDRVLAHLRTLQRKAFLGHAIAIGQYVVHEFFAGDFAAVHDKAHDKQRSFQDFLATRGEQLAELDLSATTLRTYVAAAEVAKDLPESVAAQLGLVHLRQLAAVTEVPVRQQMAHEAATLRWSKAQLGTAVGEWKRAKVKGDKRGPKPRPAVLLAAAAVRTAARKLHGLHGAAVSLGAEHRAALRVELAEIQRLLAALD
jgi:hypothetical protein